MRALGVMLALSMVGSAFADEKVVTKQALTVSGAPWVMVQTEGGNIEVRGGPAGEVKVEVERHAPTKADAEALKVTVEEKNGVVRIFYAPHPGAIRSWVSFIVQAPAPSRLQLTTSGGSIAAQGMTGGVAAATSGGSVTAKSVRGELSLKTSGGAIRADDVDGSLDARTSGGSIGVSGLLRGVNRLETSGGSIHVALSEKAKLKIDGQTSGGSASNGFGLPVVGGRIAGSVGDGSDGSLSLHTTGGSISLDRK